MSYVAVQGCTISVIAPVLIGSILPDIQTLPSTKCKADKKAIYSGELKVVVAGCTYLGLAQVNPVTITIKPEIIKKMKVEDKLCIAAGDNGITESVVTFQKGDDSATSKIQIKITDAGQSKVDAK